MATVFNRRDRLKATVAERLIGDAAADAFDELGRFISTDLQRRLPVDNGGKFPRGLDRGRYRRGMRYRVSGGGLRTKMRVLNSTANAEVLEEGRKPNSRQPPVDAIEPWVRRKGIGAKAFSIRTRRQISAGITRTFNRREGVLRTRPQSLRNIQRGIAFVIARSIGKKGIPGLFLFRDIHSYYRNQIDAARRKMFTRAHRLLNG